ncbi:hypothetical protein VTN77DRAFT_6094 [Rasamsonia byssochlamydoides]|uniref:uncharacterized protein n=1 Tax=Rasamsonia byssochlamydoides TaxID=89139 RepID=UPI00374443D9
MEATPESLSLSQQQEGYSEDPLSAHIALQEWVTQHGGRLDEHVQFARDDKRGVHLQVKPEWTSGLPRASCVIKTPLALTMSYFDAIDYRPPPSTTGAVGDDFPFFSSRGVVFPRHFIDNVGPEETMAFFLMGQYLRGSDGFWYPYIRTLPRPDELTTPLYYDDEDLVWLKMTSLAAARERRLHVWRTNYESGFKALKESGFEDAERYSWELYLWASTIIASRAFTAKVLAGIIPLPELPEDRISVLLPLIDATNHRPLAKVEWQAGNESIGLAVMEDVGPGQEVGNNYGPRNNEQLMMNYGFCIPENPCEYRVVSLRTPPGSPLSMAKARYEAEFATANGNNKATEDKDTEKYYVFSVSYPLVDPTAPLEFSIFSPDLLRAVSVIAANERELETLEITRDDGFHIPLDTYGNSRNLLASLNQILLELMTHIQKLQLSGRDLPSSPKNLKQLYAKMYRDSQIQLSKTAILFAYWTLSLSRRQRTGEESSVGTREEKESLVDLFLSRITSTGTFTPETIDQIRSKILGQESLLTKTQGKEKQQLQLQGELFQFGELFSLLPMEMQQPAEKCLRTIMSEARRVIIINDSSPSKEGKDDDDEEEDEEGNGPHSILEFATFICFLIAAHRKYNKNNNNKSSLSPRLTKWCHFLLETYPPPPADVTWVLPDEDDEAFLQAFDQVVENQQDQDSNPSNRLFSTIAHLVGDAPGYTQKDKDEDKEEGADWWLSPNWLRWAWLVLEQETVMNMVDDPVGYLVSLEKSLDGDAVNSEGGKQVTTGFSTRNFLYIPQE